jgi:hypothetical protein
VGVEAIDKINRSIKAALADIDEGYVDNANIRLKKKNAMALIYTLRKASSDLDFMSESLKNKGVGDTGIMASLKRAFFGLFGGF